MPGYRLTEEQKVFIVQKSEEGLSWSKIRLEFELKYQRTIYNSTINDLLTKKEETNSTAERPRSGRPMIYNEREQRSIVRQSILALGEGVRILADDEDINPKGASKSTINNILISNRIFSIVRPLRLKDLTIPNVKKRKKFAKTHINWSEDDWKKIIFSDESDLFPVYGGKEYVRIRENQNILDVVPLDKESQKFLTVKVWGVISSRGVGPLVRYRGTLKAKDYKEILEAHLLQNYPHLRNQYRREDGSERAPRGFLFMDDNAKTHRGKTVTKWKTENCINSLKWPASSPDLNIIENVWAYLKDELYQARKELKSPDDTWLKAQQIWHHINLDFIANLYNSLPIRISTLKINKGGIIKL